MVYILERNNIFLYINTHHLKESYEKTVVVFCTFLFIVSCSKNEISSVTGPDIEQTALTSGSWAKGLTGYTIYMDGGYATTLFHLRFLHQSRLQK